MPNQRFQPTAPLRGASLADARRGRTRALGAMKTFPVLNDHGQLHAFEIRNAFLSSRGVARFFARCPGCQIASIRRLFTSGDIHAAFLFQGVLFDVIEPFGDNSRLLISAGQAQSSQRLIEELRMVVESVPHWPSFFGPLQRLHRGVIENGG